MPLDAHFPRDGYAERLGDYILSSSPISPARSGVFLAAPRRTGKSTFVYEDLRQRLTKLGAIVIYADLWKDKKKDPGEVIAQAIRDELTKHENALLKFAKSVGFEQATIGGMKFDVSKVGSPGGTSLADALGLLSRSVQKPIVLLIDEAQHALTSEAGENSLFALKAARDQLNRTDHFGLRIVATGSNRDKLALLRNSKDQAFLGAKLIGFEPLGRDFIEWYGGMSNFTADADIDAVYELFVKAGSRPEILFQAGDSISLLPVGGSRLDQLRTEIDKEIERADLELLPTVRSLTPIQYAVLSVMAQMGADYGPFEASTMQRYQEVLDRRGSGETKANDGSVQQALNALQTKALVWRAHRGVYAIEDPAVARIITALTPSTPAAEPEGLRQ